MAAIPVSFTGVMWYPDLSVGGGPMPGGPPLGTWGGVAPPYVDIGGPAPQPPAGAHPSHPIYYPPSIWPSPGVPTHPIAPGGPPPTIWPSPGVPTHPIYFPPPGSSPPLGIWGGPYDPPRPTHPIVLPPNLPPEIPPPEGGGPAVPIDWKTAWTPQTGWVVVGIPTDPHPTPSKT